VANRSPNSQQTLPLAEADRILVRTNFAQTYRNPQTVASLSKLEDRYQIVDESDRFAGLVNFSTASSCPIHRWVRYREGFSAKLVSELLSRSNINRTRHFVADPMCGSGTTLVSAKQIGFDALGLDVNPYAVEMSSCKTMKLTDADFRSTRAAIKKISRGKLSRLPVIPSPGQVECKKYFDKNSFDALLKLFSHINSVSDAAARRCLKFSWLSIIEDCSNRKKDGNGLSSRKTQVSDVMEFFLSKAQQVVIDLERVNDDLWRDAVTIARDETALRFCDAANNFSKATGKKLGAVVFSPPYANSFDYFESYKIELLMGMGFDLSLLRETRARLVRNYRIGYGRQLTSDSHLVESICSEIEDAIPFKESLTKRRDDRTRLVPNMIRAYFEDMGKVLSEIAASLLKGGSIFLVVDQSAYVGVIVPTDLVLASIGENLGFRGVYIIKCRRALTSGQQLKLHPYLKESLRESIVVLRKF